MHSHNNFSSIGSSITRILSPDLSTVTSGTVSDIVTSGTVSDIVTSGTVSDIVTSGSLGSSDLVTCSNIETTDAASDIVTSGSATGSAGLATGSAASATGSAGLATGSAASATGSAASATGSAGLVLLPPTKKSLISSQCDHVNVTTLATTPTQITIGNIVISNTLPIN
jgi:hypothetical protein